MDPEDQWQLQPPTKLLGNISQIQWGTSKDLLSVNAVSEAYILSEHFLSSHYNEGVAVVQTSPDKLFVGLFNTNIHTDFKVDIQIRGVCTTKVTRKISLSLLK